MFVVVVVEVLTLFTTTYNLLLILAHVHTHTGWRPSPVLYGREVMTPAGDVDTLRQATP